MFYCMHSREDGLRPCERGGSCSQCKYNITLEITQISNDDNYKKYTNLFNKAFEYLKKYDNRTVDEILDSYKTKVAFINAIYPQLTVTEEVFITDLFRPIVDQEYRGKF